MKKFNTNVSDSKSHSNQTNPTPTIKFNLSPDSLACFKPQSSSILQKPNIDTRQQSTRLSQIQLQPKSLLGRCLPLRQLSKSQKPEDLSTLRKPAFDERVVFMQYENFDVYVDKSTKKKTNSSKSRSPSEPKLNYQNQFDDSDQIVSSCIRAITEETDYTSQPYSFIQTPNLSPSQTPRSSQMMNYYPMVQYYSSGQYIPTRNKRSITTEESKAFVINYDGIEFDGRTTIMVKNIPNKYSQDNLLEEFTLNHDKTFDFFYLPIDKDNECNVGYAFVNFINTSVIKTFYAEFHGKKWKKYNSAKICNLCYARYQGTLELANHFRHTKILQQKDRKLRPLIGLGEAKRIKNIGEIVRNQKCKE